MDKSHLCQPKYDVGSKKGTKILIFYYVLTIVCTKISCMFERMNLELIFKHKNNILFLHSVLSQFQLLKTLAFCRRYLWVTKSLPQASETIRFISIYIFHSIFPRFYFSSWSQTRGWWKGGPGRTRSPDILAKLKISRPSCGIFGDGRNALLFMRPEICPGLACRDIGTKQPLESHCTGPASLSHCFKHVASIW